MADLHHHHDSTPGTVVRDSEGPAGVVIAIIVLLLIGFLIWLFAFSGIVFDRDSGPTTFDNRDTTVVPGETGGDTGGTTGDTDTGTGTGASP